jgi:hypothetical protein
VMIPWTRVSDCLDYNPWLTDYIISNKKKRKLKLI